LTYALEVHNQEHLGL